MKKCLLSFFHLLFSENAYNSIVLDIILWHNVCKAHICMNIVDRVGKLLQQFIKLKLANI